MAETNPSSILATAQTIFGDGFSVQNFHGGQHVDEKRLAEYYKTGGAHSTTGIPYAINGTARVVQSNVAEWLAGYVDPIKAILGTGIQNSQKVIITRKYVVNSGAIITPEHAPARPVAIKEDTREVRLTRYGGDIDMNLNLFLLPREAKEEFDMKMAAQRLELERQLTELGYQAVMRESIPLHVALARANPSIASTDTNSMVERIYINSVFGAMAKHPFPVANLLAAARHANMYTPPSGAGKYSVLLVPPGMLDIAHYTRPDSMKYSISGFKQSENTSLQLDMPGVYLEPNLGVKILVSKRLPSYANGTAFPEVFGEGYLNEEASWATYYNIPEDDDMYEYGIVDYETGTIFKPDGGTGGVYYRPCMTAMMGSAILCANPGAQTGEMLFAYPSTALSSDKEIETLKCQLRVYMGAAIYQPENLLRLPHVSFEGLLYGHKKENVYPFTGSVGGDMTRDKFPTNFDEEARWKSDYEGSDGDEKWKNERVYAGAVFRRSKQVDAGDRKRAADALEKARKDLADKKGKDDEDEREAFKAAEAAMSRFAAQGSAIWSLYSKNEGHLGLLDDPEQCDRLHGMHHFSASTMRV